MAFDNPNTTPEPEQRASAANDELHTTPLTERQTALVSSLESSHFASPASRNPRAVDIPTRDVNPQALERYMKHAKTIGTITSTIDYEDFLKELDLLSSYWDFKAGTDKLFQSISRQAPALCEEKLYYSSKTPFKATEKDLVAWFKSAYVTLKRVDFLAYPLAQPAVNYLFVDHQNKTVNGCDVKPDVALYYPNRPRKDISDVHFFIEAKRMEINALSGKNLGQIADYAYQLWKVQPMRKFVPVFLLNGCRLSVIVFARDGCYRVELGSLFRQDPDESLSADEEVANTLSILWFLIIQPPDKFGHITDVSVGASLFIFSGTVADAAVQAISMIQSAKISNEDPNRMVAIGERVDRDIRVVGRLCHVYRVTYGDKRAILKLSWAKPDKFPEGAVYETLEQSAMKGIPAVYSSGVLCKEFSGYRLEYLLLEDCGETLWDIIKKLASKKIRHEWVYGIIPKVIKQVLCHLLQAYSAGVMHRDISSGNISIKGDDVFIIDWGCSKLLIGDSRDKDNRYERLAKKWGFELEGVVDKENARDPFTGTHEYISIRVLSGSAERNIFDDIESLFYVILHLLQCAKEGKITDFLGTRCMPNNVAAVMKVGFMCDPNFYKQDIVNECCPNDLLKILDQMYEMLFMIDGVNVCAQLFRGIPEKRKLNHHLLRSIVGKDTLYAMFHSNISESPEGGIEPSSIAVLSAFSQLECSEISRPSAKRKAEDEADADVDAYCRKKI